MLFKTLYDRIRGHATLLPYEKTCLDAWRDSLSSNSKRILDAQLAAARLTQRQAEGAKLCFYYPADGGVQLFSNIDPDLHVATVTLAEDGQSDSKEMKVKVFVHRGKFFSLEFPKRPARFAEQHHLNLAKLMVKRLTIHIELDS